MIDCKCSPWSPAATDGWWNCLDSVQSYLGGRRESADQLFERFRGLVWAVVTRSLRHAQHADHEDAVQSVFLALFSRLRRFENRCPFCKFVAVVAQRRMIDWHRGRSTPTVGVADAEAIPDTRAPPLTLRQIECLDRTLQAFPETWRQVWQLHSQKQSVAKISRELGIPERTLRSWLHSITRELSACFDQF